MKNLLLLFIFLIFAYNTNADEILQPNHKKGRYSPVFTNKVLVRIKPGYDIFNKDAILLKNNEHRADYLLNPKASITYNNSLRKSLSPELQSNKIFSAEEKLLRTFVLHYDGSLEPEDYCKKLVLTNPAIEIAEPYYVPEFFEFLPNDPLIPNQDDNLKLIKAYETWDIEKGNPDIIIGISDGGANQEHEDLINNIGINEAEIPDDGIDNDGNGYIDDYAGYDFSWESTGSAYPGNTFNSFDNHGQQVAGIAGASTNNGIGIAGIGFNSRIFPLKIIEGNTLKYAYESIIYAAVRGLKVINCSWGVVKTFSDIDQSVIDFAVSRDVAIVSAAGNTSTRATKYDLFYPSGYYGVLGVGEVNTLDRLVGSSSISAGCRILAPGEGNHTTTNFGYSRCDGGTSFSAPVVAGAVALARSRFPQLSAIQSLEFVRQAVDKHPNFSSSDLALIPGRLNLLKAVTTDPFSIPAILPHKYSYYGSDGIETDRFKAGDIVKVKIAAKNVLGSAPNLRFVLSKAYDPAVSVAIQDSVMELSFVQAGEEIYLDEFSMRITQNFSGFVIMRVDIIGENGYRDFFKFNFVPAKDISTFSNNMLKFSMSDIGEFGFSSTGSTISGIGFAYGNYGNQIYRNSSIMMTANPNKIVYNANMGKTYHFSTIKSFMPPDRNIAIFDDSNGGSNKIGVEIKQEILFQSLNSKATRMNFTLKNTSGDVIEDAAFGLYIDWDIGKDAEKNRTQLLNDAIPQEFGNKAAAQIAYAQLGYPFFGAAAYSSFPTTEAQAAGIDYSESSNFDSQRRYLSLNSGKSLQSINETDIGAVTGVKFAGSWEPDETRECIICVGAGDDIDDLALALKNCLLGVTSVKNSIVSDNFVSIFPNPASDIVYLQFLNDANNFEYSVHDLIGNNLAMNENLSNLSAGESIGIDVSSLPHGVYLLKFNIDGNSRIEKIIISR